MMCYGALKSNIDQGRIVLLHLTFPIFFLCTRIHFWGLYVVFIQIQKNT